MTTRYRFRSMYALNRMFARAACLLLLAASVARAQYTAIDLYTLQPPAGLDHASPSGAFAGQVVGHAAVPSDPDATPPPPPHAVLWKQDGSPMDLTLAGFDATRVAGTDGTYQFGWGTTGRPGFVPVSTPVVWSGSAASATFLGTQGFASAEVAGGGGGQFVGSGKINNPGAERALLWNGLTAQPIDLSPTNLGFVHHFAKGTNGAQQVGFAQGFEATNNAYYHALLWSGSAASAVDLHPTHLPGITNSEAVATDGQQQVGNGGDNLALDHALLWSGSADSAVILTPPGFGGSKAFGVRNGQQVGLARERPFDNSRDHAMLWSGTAESAVDLHVLLPDSYTSSHAYGIDDAGHVFGVAFNSADQLYHAIEWVPIPEPGSATLLAIAGLGLLARRRRPFATGSPA